jgi:hypothetical protein
MKGTKLIGIGLAVLGLAFGVMAAERTAADIQADIHAAGKARDYAAWEALGAELLATPDAQTNSVLFALALRVRVVGLWYTDGRDAARAEHGKLQALLPEGSAERLNYYQNTWGHWSHASGGVLTAEECVDEVAPYVADIRAGKSTLAKSVQDYCVPVYICCLFEAGRNDLARELYVEALAARGSALLLSGRMARIGIALGEEAAVRACAAAIEDDYLRAAAEVQIAEAKSENPALNAAVVSALVKGAQKLSPGQLETYFNKLSPALMTSEEYQSALKDIIKAVPAVETNAAFLGRVKSELEKMK